MKDVIEFIKQSIEFLESIKNKKDLLKDLVSDDDIEKGIKDTLMVIVRMLNTICEKNNLGNLLEVKIKENTVFYQNFVVSFLMNEAVDILHEYLLSIHRVTTSKDDISINIINKGFDIEVVIDKDIVRVFEIIVNDKSMVVNLYTLEEYLKKLKEWLGKVADKFIISSL